MKLIETRKDSRDKTRFVFMIAKTEAEFLVRLCGRYLRGAHRRNRTSELMDINRAVGISKALGASLKKPDPNPAFTL